MKNYTTLGIIFGLVLAFFLTYGLWWALLAILLAAVGGVVGAHYDGRIDLGALWGRIVGSDKGRG